MYTSTRRFDQCVILCSCRLRVYLHRLLSDATLFTYIIYHTSPHRKTSSKKKNRQKPIIVTHTRQAFVARIYYRRHYIPQSRIVPVFYPLIWYIIIILHWVYTQNVHFTRICCTFLYTHYYPHRNVMLYTIIIIRYIITCVWLQYRDTIVLCDHDDDNIFMIDFQFTPSRTGQEIRQCLIIFICSYAR